MISTIARTHSMELKSLFWCSCIIDLRRCPFCLLLNAFLASFVFHHVQYYPFWPIKNISFLWIELFLSLSSWLSTVRSRMIGQELPLSSTISLAFLIFPFKCHYFSPCEFVQGKVEQRLKHSDSLDHPRTHQAHSYPQVCLFRKRLVTEKANKPNVHT
jgi:hypothetical protein